MEKVLVAMSGGVDSSVAAHILLEQGFHVEGVFMKNWCDEKDSFGVCSWKSDRRDAMAVASKLGIRLNTVNFEKEYEDFVLNSFFKEYSKGNTPNPDIICNKLIKFGMLLKYAKENGFAKIATGHYACKKVDKNGVHIRIPKDKIKDQTYFLSQLNQSQLYKSLFPLCNLEKKEVKKIAQKLELGIHQKKESMGICFIGKIPIKKFLMQRIKIKKGPIFAFSYNNKVGSHDGIFFHTIGQRHGLQIRNSKQRLYVIEKNYSKNSILVGERDDPRLYAKKALVTNLNWIPKKPAFPTLVHVRIRHRGALHKARIYDKIKKKGNVEIDFIEKPWALSAGQFCVFYKNSECIGGGMVKKTL